MRLEARVALAGKNASNLSGPSLRIGDWLSRAGLWQLSERVYLPAAVGFVGGDSAFQMPGLQAADRLL